MILGIEVFVFQVVGMTLVGLIVFDVSDQGVEVELLLVYSSGGICLFLTIGFEEPSTKLAARGYGDSCAVVEFVDWVAFLDSLLGDHLVIGVVVEDSIVGFPYEVNDIGLGSSGRGECYGDGDIAGWLAAVDIAGYLFISNGANGTITHSSGDGIGGTDHIRFLAYLYSALIVAIGIFGKKVLCGVLLAVGGKGGERRLIASAHIAVDVELEEISIL